MTTTTNPAIINVRDLTPEMVTTINGRKVAFRYNDKIRVGSIERLQGGAVTLKHTIQTKEKTGRPFGAYTLTKIVGKITIELVY